MDLFLDLLLGFLALFAIAALNVLTIWLVAGNKK